jgi:hypothetical protein
MCGNDLGVCVSGGGGGGILMLYGTLEKDYVLPVICKQ